MLEKHMNKRFMPFILGLALAIGFTGGIYYQKYQSTGPLLQELTGGNRAGQPDGVDFSLFWETWNTLQNRFVDKDKLKTQDLIFGAIDGMVKKAGDPYTVFFTPQENESFNQEISGSFGGVGMEIGLRNDVLTVIAPIKDSPAQRAGIRAGDKIIKIDDKPTNGLKVHEAVNLIRGKKGTQVKITFMRNGASEAKEVAITRDTIKIPAVEWSLVDGTTAHIELFSFNKNADAEFKKAAQEILNSKADRIILDVRSNPGGLLDSAVNIASYFLDANQLVTIEKFGNGTQNEFRTQPNGILKRYPLVILANKGSASASEILAGALKDNRHITIIGEKTFGKGSVQEVIDLPQKTSLKVTIAKWLTPKGTSINDNGISPDVEVVRTEEDVNSDKDPQLEKAKALVKKR